MVNIAEQNQIRSMLVGGWGGGRGGGGRAVRNKAASRTKRWRSAILINNLRWTERTKFIIGRWIGNISYNSTYNVSAEKCQEGRCIFTDFLSAGRWRWTLMEWRDTPQSQLGASLFGRTISRCRSNHRISKDGGWTFAGWRGARWVSALSFRRRISGLGGQNF